MKKYIIGLDIGGTGQKLGLFTHRGELVQKTSFPTDCSCGGKNILPAAAGAIESLLAAQNISKDRLIGVGVGSPGFVTDCGVVKLASNLGWHQVDIPARLGALLQLPVRAANDANAAALGEMWQGSGKDCRSMVLLTLGTGVGGGIIIDGRPLAGHGGGAGEVGHIQVDPAETELCSCGGRGCLEQYAGGRGVARLAARRLARDSAPSTLRTLASPTAKEVFDAIKAGDPVAAEIGEEFADYLGRGLAMLAMILDPEVFVIGGGLSKAGEVLLQLIRPAYQRQVMECCRDREFRLASLGSDAGIYGAAALFAGEEQV